MSDLSWNSTQLVVPSVQVLPASDLPNLWTFQYLHANAGLPLLACSIFFAFSLIHISMLVISKRFYMLPLIAGFLLQFLGQIFKIICVASTSPSNALNYYALYSLTTNLAPCLFLTSVVWMIQRMMKASDRVCFPFIVRIAMHQIIMLEVVAFWLQAYGLLVQMNPLLSPLWSVGNLVTLVGSAIELFNFLWVWLSLSIILWKQRSRSSSTVPKPFAFHFWAFATIITISVTLVMIHTISKFVFHLKDPQLEPFRNELLTFLLQSLPIALCAAFLAVFHPYRYDGGIPDKEHSFFSPGTSMIPSLGNELGESSCRSVNRTSNGSDPFSAVPLATECSPMSRQMNSQILSLDHSYLHSNRFPSGSNSYQMHRSNTSDCEKIRDDQEISHVEDATSREPEVFRIDTKVHRKRSPQLNDLSIMRKHTSSYYEKKFDTEHECQNDRSNSPTVQHDEYSVGSYYEDPSKLSAPIWPENPISNDKTSSTILSLCNESMYSGAYK